jgi:hypothetical protein
MTPASASLVGIERDHAAIHSADRLGRVLIRWHSGTTMGMLRALGRRFTLSPL